MGSGEGGLLPCAQEQDHGREWHTPDGPFLEAERGGHSGQGDGWYRPGATLRFDPGDSHTGTSQWSKPRMIPFLGILRWTWRGWLAVTFSFNHESTRLLKHYSPVYF